METIHFIVQIRFQKILVRTVYYLFWRLMRRWLDHQEYSVTVTEIEIDPMIWISDSVRLCYLLFIYIVWYRSWKTTTYAVTSLWEAFVENSFPCRQLLFPNISPLIDLEPFLHGISSIWPHKLALCLFLHGCLITWPLEIPLISFSFSS
jgi:hypothetical protein